MGQKARCVMNVILTAFPLSKMPNTARNHTTLHKAVMGLFPPLGDNPRAEAGVLFRVETEHGRVLIQSTAVPSPQQLTEVGAPSKSISIGTLAEGTEFNYRIDVAAVRRIRKVERRLSSSEIPDWWADLAGRHGFELLGDSSGHLISTEDRTSSSAQPHLRVATLEGIGRVTHPDSFHAAQVNGVGRAKAYGCGLLSAARL